MVNHLRPAGPCPSSRYEADQAGSIAWLGERSFTKTGTRVPSRQAGATAETSELSSCMVANNELKGIPSKKAVQPREPAISDKKEMIRSSDGLGMRLQCSEGPPKAW